MLVLGILIYCIIIAVIIIFMVSINCYHCGVCVREKDAVSLSRFI